MRQIKSAFALAIVITLSATSLKAQKGSIQALLDGLMVGQSGREDLIKCFGMPTETKIVSEWVEEKDKDQVALYAFPDKLNRQFKGQRRTLYEWKYPQQKISFWLLDNPWQVNSIEINTDEVAINGLRVGEKLERVQELLGEADWSTSEESDSWVAEYESRGLQFSFARDMNDPKYPMKLAQPAMIRTIEIFDNKVSFLSR